MTARPTGDLAGRPRRRDGGVPLPLLVPAVVGVVFFGLVSSRAPAAAADVTPALRAQLNAANVASPAVASTVATFTRCFETQTSSSDPTQPVPGCPSPSRGQTASPISAATSGAARSALAHDFVGSLERVLFFNVGFWALTGLLSLLLPRTRPAAAPRAAAH